MTYLKRNIVNLIDNEYNRIPHNTHSVFDRLKNNTKSSEDTIQEEDNEKFTLPPNG